MEQLKTEFSYNWNNKLDCTYFTTIRLYTKKYKVGDKHEIILKKKFKKFAEVKEIRVINIDSIDEYIAGLDTGYNKEQTQNLIKEMYKNIVQNWEVQRLVFVLFKTID